MDRFPQRLAPGITELIERTVREFMDSYGLVGVRSYPGTDHDGDPVIWVEADYENRGEPIDPSVMTDLVLALRDRVWNAGEERFPHVRHKFDERQQVLRTPARRAGR